MPLAEETTTSFPATPFRIDRRSLRSQTTARSPLDEAREPRSIAFSARFTDRMSVSALTQLKSAQEIGGLVAAEVKIRAHDRRGKPLRGIKQMEGLLGQQVSRKHIAQFSARQKRRRKKRRQFSHGVPSFRAVAQMEVVVGRQQRVGLKDLVAKAPYRAFSGARCPGRQRVAT